MSSIQTQRGGAFRRAALLTAMAGSLFAYDRALAQSTGSQTVEQVVVTAQKTKGVDGLGVISQVAKDQSIVTSDYIQSQVGSSNFAQLISMVPGVVYSTEDPGGILSSDFRMHGFDGAHVSFTVDGTPLNDTGNYAIYPGEYAVGESVDHITVNTGQTEVDSPTASAIGGTVNIVSKVPSAAPGATAKVSGGGFNYNRGYAELQTGAFGPTGLRAYLSGNFTQYDKYQGNGTEKRVGFDGRLYQQLKGDDFLSAAFTYTSDRAYFYQSSSRAQFNQYGNKIDWNTTWVQPTAVAGSADGVVPSAPAAPGQVQGNDSNFWKLHPNPVDFFDLRAQSRFTLLNNLILTVDPYFFYTLANGGGTTSLKESDKRLIGNATPTACAKGGTGVDLNGDGDCLDTVLVYSPSNTQTHRLGVEASLIYDLTPTNRFQLAFTEDYGRHRQTGQMTPIDQSTGTPFDVFGAKNGYGQPIYTADGSIMRTRDRFSIAELTQVAANYIGKFDDEKLHVNLGVRLPRFTRDLNQYCYTYNGGSAYCDSISPTLVAAALAADTAAHTVTNLNTLLGTSVALNPATNAPNFRMPFKQTYHFNKVLPNVGATYAFDAHNLVYVTYAQGFSAPKTDNLYTSASQTVRPETSDQVATGYRYQGSSLLGSASLWGAQWKNHIVQSYDPNDPTLSIDRNVGNVDLYGVDLEGGWKATKHLSFYASAAYTHTEMKQNYALTTTAGPDKAALLPVAGKQLVMTPDYTASLRAEYKTTDWTFGANTQYVGRRFLSDMNDNHLAPYYVLNLDAEYRFKLGVHPAAVDFNVSNALNKTYYVRSSTVSNTNAVVLANGDTFKANTNYMYNAAPAWAFVTLKVQY